MRRKAREAPSSSSSSAAQGTLQRTQQGQLAQASQQWEEVMDKRTGQVYFWNRQTSAHVCPDLVMSAACSAVPDHGTTASLGSLSDEC